MNSLISVILVVSILLVGKGDGHGMLMRPPSRSSIWRIPEFQHLNPLPNYTDNELFCGSLLQDDDPGSNCGVCGDPFSSPRPRDNEVGGLYDAGIITAQYQSGQDIEIEVILTAAHLGALEFRLCTDHRNEVQECFNQHVLQLSSGGGTRLPVPPEGEGEYRTRVRLPPNVRCERCVIQWNYRSGNRWGECHNGTSANGCGPQETFRGCADVKIL